MRQPTLFRTKAPLAWFGSDSAVAEQLAGKLSACKHVTIPFCGGMAILPHLTARAIVANDKHDAAINFYRVASGVLGEDARQDLLIRCQHTLSHPSELSTAQSLVKSGSNDSLRAWAFWAMCWIGRKGQGGTSNQGGLPSVRRTAIGGTNASRVKSAACDLPCWAEQFERCEWECRDFREVLADVKDRPDCGLYVDAPWVKAGKGYLHSFAEQDHRDLRDLLAGFSETVIVVRYDDCDLIRELYADWTIETAESTSQSGGKVSEVWISAQKKPA